jgi:hypothetical protein
MGAAPQPTTGRAMVNVFDGTRQLYSDNANLLISVIDGNQHVLSRQFHKDASVLFTGLPIAHNAADNYSVLAAAGGYKDAGFFPVKMAAGAVQIVNLMLLPNLNQFNFSGAAWNIVGTKKPDLQAVLAADLDDATAAEARYNDLKDFNAGQVLACLLNILTAMDQIALPQKTPIHYLKSLIWDQKGDNAMAQDRFYGWADPTIIDQLEASKTQGTFVDAPFQLHKGATRSYKQIQFGEANVQFDFPRRGSTDGRQRELRQDRTGHRLLSRLGCPSPVGGGRECIRKLNRSKDGLRFAMDGRPARRYSRVRSALYDTAGLAALGITRPRAQGLFVLCYKACHSRWPLCV